jgi:signal transduction histidine kinase
MSQSVGENSNLLENAIARLPLLVSPNTPILDAIGLMSENRSSYILISEEQKLLGILTERDIVKITFHQMPLEGIPISQIMTTNVIALTLEEAGDIFSVLSLLRSSQIRHLPILDSEKNIIGIITPESVRQVLKATDLLKMRRVSEIITSKNVMTASKKLSVFEVTQQMTIHRKSCIVIGETNNNGKIIPQGIITERDIVKFKLSQRDLHQTQAEKVMSSPLLPAKLDFTLWQAHQIMQDNNIRRLVVVDQKGYLAGILTQTSILHALDPVEMYTTVQILQQSINAKTEELIVVNSQMEQEVKQRAIAEEKLHDLNKLLEQQVKQRTLELTETNALLASRNQELQQTLEHLQNTQQDLIHSEKMAALGQLIAGVTHEINNPLAALRSSVHNIDNILNSITKDLPDFFRQISAENYQVFQDLLKQAKTEYNNLSSKEKRQIKRKLITVLEEKNVAESDEIAELLVEMGIYEISEDQKSGRFFQDINSLNILERVYELVSLQQSTRNIINATERAAKIVLALKKFIRRNHSDQKEIANIREGIETVLTLYHNQLKHGIEIIKYYDPNVPDILCYPDELNQVWTNLLHNSLHAMNYQGILKIEVTQQEENIIVSVIDNGKGIPPEILPKIFQPYFTTKPAGEGSGLGLQIVKKIIDKHGGKIEVDSQPGQTTFSIFLPKRDN